jgi:hypothetical protein
MKPFTTFIHSYFFVTCMQIGFHIALRLYVQLLPRCFGAVIANTHVTYILGTREKLSKHDMTQLCG